MSVGGKRLYSRCSINYLNLNIMKSIKGTKTEKNLMEAFAGESQARNKYTYYASKAKKDGFVQIGNLFEETANQEKEHAKIWFKLLCGGKVQDTINNLIDAADGETAVFAQHHKSDDIGAAACQAESQWGFASYYHDGMLCFSVKYLFCFFIV